MIYEWDEAKRASNLAKHGIDFEEVRSFDWDRAPIQEDLRRDDGERRHKAVGVMWLDPGGGGGGLHRPGRGNSDH